MFYTHLYFLPIITHLLSVNICLKEMDGGAYYSFSCSYKPGFACFTLDLVVPCL